MGGYHGVQDGICVPLVCNIKGVGKHFLVRMGAERFEVGERGV
jgi:hypothetical protein